MINRDEQGRLQSLMTNELKSWKMKERNTDVFKRRKNKNRKHI